MDHVEAKGPLDPNYGVGLGEHQEMGAPSPGILQTLDQVTPPVVERDFAVAAASHHMKGVLSPRAVGVKTGTPLLLEADGYVVAPDPNGPFDMVCANAPINEHISGWLVATVETYKKQFRMGDKYRIKYVDSHGQVYFEVDPAGPYKAMSDTQILMRARG